MKRVLGAVLVMLLVSSFACTGKSNSNNTQPPYLPPPSTTQPEPVLPKIKPPESTPSPDPPPRTDPSLVSLQQMQELWASGQLPYYGEDPDDTKTHYSKEEVLKRGQEWFASHPDVPNALDLNAIQVIEARVTVDPKFFEFNRLTWFIDAPPIMGLWVPAASTVPSEDAPALYFWNSDYVVMMDDETGDFWGGSTINQISHVAPRFTINQFKVVQQYANLYGWWAAWYRTQGYNGSTLPQSVIDEMQALLK